MKTKGFTKKICYFDLNKNQLKIVLITIFITLAEFFDLFIISFVVSFISEKEMYKDMSDNTGIILSSSGFGIILGYLIFGYISELYGRKSTIIISIFIISFFNSLFIFINENDWMLFSFIRLMIGLGSGGINVTILPYLHEFIPYKRRGVISGISSLFVPIGLFLGSFATSYFIDKIGWKGVIILGSFPIVLLIWIYNLPESPYFLIKKNRIENAIKSYSWAFMLSREKVLKNFIKLKHKKVSIKKIIKKNKFNLIIISLGFFCFTLSSFFIQSCGQILLKNIFFIKINEISKIFLYLSLGNLSGRLLSSFISDYIKRKYVIFIFGFFGSIGYIFLFFSVFHEMNSEYDFPNIKIFIIGLFIIMIFGDGAFGVINTFGSEIFIKEAKSICLGISHGIGATAKIIGPIYFSNIYKINYFSYFDLPKYFILLSFFFLFGCIIYLFSKEIKL
ncbi:ygcS [Wigglesworthia glossinidia endosymbiont of Glossina brevipalpis]|uniref:YgcS protein n=1 Tax=Wigglesworthia glossinidia brevipalpis TaxID=36870 RepID=Q8D314_WIGBR|nr:ygcS [Wigglesworthia glossinidia endosymbiont of Glossina brevipalpis]